MNQPRLCPRCESEVNPDGICYTCKAKEEARLAALDSKDPGEEAGISRTTGMRKASVSIPTKVFPLLTLNEVPGRVITTSLGLVIGAGTRQMGLTSSNLVTNTFKTASEQLIAAAQSLGADAVVAVKMSLEERQGIAGTVNQTVTLTGTAVKLK